MTRCMLNGWRYILPKGGLGLILSRTSGRRHSRHVGGGRGSVLKSHWTGSRDAVRRSTRKGGVQIHTSLQRLISTTVYKKILQQTASRNRRGKGIEQCVLWRASLNAISPWIVILYTRSETSATGDLARCFLGTCRYTCTRRKEL